MKFSLTITDASPSELSALLATLNGSTAHTHTAAVTVNQDEDDTTGDVAAAAGTVDKAGLPWDDRIHSTPAVLTTKGVWRAKRGNTAENVAKVEAELRARMSGMTVPAQQPQPAPVYQPPAQQPGAVNYVNGAPVPVPLPDYQQPTQPQPVPPVPLPYQQPTQPQPVPLPYQPQPAPVQQPVPLPQPPAQPAVAGLDPSAFMGRIQTILATVGPNGAPLADGAYLASVTQRVGQAFNQQLGSITDLFGNQAMIDYAVQIMASEGRWV